MLVRDQGPNGLGTRTVPVPECSGTTMELWLSLHTAFSPADTGAALPGRVMLGVLEPSWLQAAASNSWRNIRTESFPTRVRNVYPLSSGQQTSVRVAPDFSTCLFPDAQLIYFTSSFSMNHATLFGLCQCFRELDAQVRYRIRIRSMQVTRVRMCMTNLRM